MRRLARLGPLLLVIAVSAFLVPTGTLGAQPASPAGGAPAPTIKTLVTTTFPEAALPDTSSRSFLLWYATILPNTEVILPPNYLACCPGPQIEHVLEGELTLQVEGPLRVVRAATGESPGPVEEVAPGAAVVLRPGDTALYALEAPVTYRNAGTARVRLVAGGLVGGSPPGPPPGYAINTFDEIYPAPPLPAGPLTATLQQTTLAPDGFFPAPPSGTIQLVMPGPERGAVAERRDGSARNLGLEPVVVYALLLAPASSSTASPIATP